MAYIVMAHIVMAYIVMAHIVMATRPAVWRHLLNGEETMRVTLAPRANISAAALTGRSKSEMGGSHGLASRSGQSSGGISSKAPSHVSSSRLE